MAPEGYYRAIAILNAAKSYLDVFDFSAQDKADRLRAVKKEYRQLARYVHPDRVQPCDYDVAEDLYKRLGDMFAEAEQAIKSDTVGMVKASAAFTTRTAVHQTETEVTAWCDMTSCYMATTTMMGGTTIPTFVKLAHTPADNDLLAAEATAIAKLRDKGDPKRIAFYPELLDSFAATNGGKRLRGNVFTRLEGFYNLEQVHARYPGGISSLDMGWMWRRVLWALDYVHGNGLVHGAMLPQNIMILPRQHGVVLVDWCYSSTKLDKTYRPLKAVVGRQKAWYPDSVFRKEPPVPGLDIAHAARSMIYLIGGDPVMGTLPPQVPSAIANYFSDCMKLGDDAKATVPDVAVRFDELLKRLGKPYYPRTFRPFEM